MSPSFAIGKTEDEEEEELGKAESIRHENTNAEEVSITGSVRVSRQRFSPFAAPRLNHFRLAKIKKVR